MGNVKEPGLSGRGLLWKTERVSRRKITRPLRQKGGFSARSSANREREPQEWIAVPVPALVSTETFAMAQKRLIENKRLSARKTKMPTLLQGLLVCGQCGYGLYRTSTKTTKRQVQYYRCLGSDRYRHLREPVCQCRPIRQDYLDKRYGRKSSNCSTSRNACELRSSAVSRKARAMIRCSSANCG